ncbi:MAG: hypothetical protein WDW38_007547 [Sanguina aurantia]
MLGAAQEQLGVITRSLAMLSRTRFATNWRSVGSAIANKQKKAPKGSCGAPRPPQDRCRQGSRTHQSIESSSSFRIHSGAPHLNLQTHWVADGIYCLLESDRACLADASCTLAAAGPDSTAQQQQQQQHPAAHMRTQQFRDGRGRGVREIFEAVGAGLAHGCLTPAALLHPHYPSKGSAVDPLELHRDAEAFVESVS